LAADIAHINHLEQAALGLADQGKNSEKPKMALDAISAAGTLVHVTVSFEAALRVLVGAWNAREACRRSSNHFRA
jgi:hypothetical protein